MIPNSIEATSEAVIQCGGPVLKHGSLAITSLPSDMVKSNTLLKLPSILVIYEHLIEEPKIDAARAHSLSTSNLR